MCIVCDKMKLKYFYNGLQSKFIVAFEKMKHYIAFCAAVLVAAKFVAPDLDTGLRFA